MNVIALISAVVGLAFLYLVFVLANKITNRWARFAAIVFGILVAISVSGAVPLLLGDRDVVTAMLAGRYLATIGVLLVVVSAVISRIRKRKTE